MKGPIQQKFKSHAAGRCPWFSKILLVTPILTRYDGILLTHPFANTSQMEPHIIKKNWTTIKWFRSTPSKKAGRLFPYAPIPFASGFGVGFGYLNTFKLGIWSTRGYTNSMSHSSSAPLGASRRKACASTT